MLRFSPWSVLRRRAEATKGGYGPWSVGPDAIEAMCRLWSLMVDMVSCVVLLPVKLQCLSPPLVQSISAVWHLLFPGAVSAVRMA